MNKIDEFLAYPIYRTVEEDKDKYVCRMMKFKDIQGRKLVWIPILHWIIDEASFNEAAFLATFPTFALITNPSLYAKKTSVEEVEFVCNVRIKRTKVTHTVPGKISTLITSAKIEGVDGKIIESTSSCRMVGPTTTVTETPTTNCVLGVPLIIKNECTATILTHACVALFGISQTWMNDFSLYVRPYTNSQQHCNIVRFAHALFSFIPFVPPCFGGSPDSAKRLSHLHRQYHSLFELFDTLTKL